MCIYLYIEREGGRERERRDQVATYECARGGGVLLEPFCLLCLHEAAVVVLPPLWVGVGWMGGFFCPFVLSGNLDGVFSLIAFAADTNFDSGLTAAPLWSPTITPHFLSIYFENIYADAHTLPAVRAYIQVLLGIS